MKRLQRKQGNSIEFIPLPRPVIAGARRSCSIPVIVLSPQITDTESSRPGIVTGLVAYSSGGNGSILFIEVADMPGSGSVQLTGKLGDVLKESVEVALSWVKAHAYELGLTHDPSENIMKKRSIHVHCPSGAIPKVCSSSIRYVLTTYDYRMVRLPAWRIQLR